MGARVNALMRERARVTAVLADATKILQQPHPRIAQAEPAGFRGGPEI